MKRIIGLAATIVVVALILGLWLSTGTGDSIAAKSAAKLGLSPAFGPYIFPVFGGLYLLLVSLSKHGWPEGDGLSRGVSKSRMPMVMGLLFGPLLALLLQTYSGLQQFDLIDKNGMMMGLAILDVLFFLFMGNYMTTVTWQSRIGFRSPWTMKSEQVWVKSHRILGRGLVVISFLALVLLAFMDPKTVIFVHIGTIIGLKLVVYLNSYHLWRKARLQSA
ncbi:hypothetical protein JCM17844_18780 [Iodidimonas gelatinilytica]|uniref:DUF1648 domain-containing protein n=1 Tax=Iodidimonas gelatinilytica TaxID=1236966 RepID=A0A5A7MQM9_9PROT|nr:SdpI family protein [Iodidimonas gelatinilytica]GEQ98241.1 hypothetical protein JCM17844_18780 [Iodidimonas gelatinilytica]